MVLATLALSNSEFDSCIDSCLRALKINSSVPNINLTLGKAYAMKRDFAKSDQALKRELELNATSIEPYIFLVQNNIARENFLQALTDVQHIIPKFPSVSYLHVLAGNILARLDDIQAAEKSYQRAIHIDNNDYRCFVSLGILYFNMGDKDRAAIELEKSLNIKLTASALTVLSQIYSEQGSTDKAFDYARRSISLSDATAQSYCHLASLYLQAEDPNNAKLLMQTALKKNKYLADCYLLSSRIFSYTKEYQSAINILNEGLLLLKNNHLLEGELVRIKFVKGEYDDNNNDWHLDQQSEYYFDDCWNISRN